MRGDAILTGKKPVRFNRRKKEASTHEEKANGRSGKKKSGRRPVIAKKEEERRGKVLLGDTIRGVLRTTVLKHSSRR